MQLGLIGLGTMGANLARNAASAGATVAVYNRSPEKTDAFIKEYGDEGNFIACKTLEELRDALTPPRPILLMVKAGNAVDAVIEDLIPLLDDNDIIIDGGNSHYSDTERREKNLSEGKLPLPSPNPNPNPTKLCFVGMGVSGGEEGALNGPSMMPGGDYDAYKQIEDLLVKMAANDGDDGTCVTHIGTGGAGHFVKMVHNGIEYAMMQLIAESYDILKSEAGKTNKELAELFTEWSKSKELGGYLMEITAKIFEKKDNNDYMLDIIKDTAKQKGTGKWTTQAALDFGVPVPTITAAVDARITSGSQFLRKIGSEFPEEIEQSYPKSEKLVARVRTALEISIILSYFQGIELIRVASEEKGWNIDLAEVARIWRGGCIIRSQFLTKLQALYGKDDKTKKETHDAICDRMSGQNQYDWRRCIQIAQGRGVPIPALSSALAHFDAMRRKHLPQNLIQAQRDLFGAHTFERIDKEGVFHAEW